MDFEPHRPDKDCVYYAVWFIVIALLMLALLATISVVIKIVRWAVFT